MTETTAIDIAALETLRMVLGDEINDLLDEYCRLAPELYEKLTSAAGSGDADNTAALAHQLKGMSANLHISGFAELCRTLEHHGKSGDMADINTAVADGKQLLDEAITQIQGITQH